MDVMNLETGLELESRRVVFECIQRFPGIHLRELQRKLDMPMGSLEFHLHFLETKRFISVQKEEHYKCYYPARSGIKDKKLLSLLRREVPRKVMVHLLENNEAKHGDILGVVEVSPSTLSFHLKKLMKAGIVAQRKEGRIRYYRLKNPETVLEMLITYRESFLDEVVDRFVDIWMDIGLD